jgi:hypothetical protein
VYGTLAFMRAMPGRRREAGELIRSLQRPISGLIVNYIYELDRDPEEAVMLAVFDQKAAYERNAASSGQHERYLTYRSLLTEDPQWHDGEVRPYLAFADRQPEQGMYGTIARLTVRPGGEPGILKWFDDADNSRVAGALALWSLSPDQEPGIIYLATAFDSKRSYWENAENPAQDAEYRRLREHLLEDPEWHDGAILALHRI